MRYWRFAEEEGGTTVIEADEEHLRLSVYGGPDCDLTTTETHKEYVLTKDVDHDGVWTRTGPFRTDPWVIQSLNPDEKFFDDLVYELGSNLYCNKPLLGMGES